MNKLRAYRSERGLSQADFAKSVGVKKATISRIEKGRRVPSMGLVSRMVEASGGALAADDFMPAVDAPPAEPERAS